MPQGQQGQGGPPPPPPPPARKLQPSVAPVTPQVGESGFVFTLAYSDGNNPLDAGVPQLWVSGNCPALGITGYAEPASQALAGLGADFSALINRMISLGKVAVAP